MRVANRRVCSVALENLTREVEGYGSFGFSPAGYGTGYLPERVARIYRGLGSVPTVLSYATPVAWLDRGKWIIPVVSYSATTGKHQSYLWDLPDRVYIPWDCGLEEYESYVSGRSVYDRWTGKIAAG